MKRRLAIRNLLIITSGTILLPACSSNDEHASVKVTNITIDAQQERLLKAIASTIIPTTDTPGAGQVGAHLFVIKMLDDMYEKEVQQNFMKGLKQLEAHAKKQYNNSFIDCTLNQQQEILLGIENKNGYSDIVLGFYKIMKQRTIEGYLSSKYVLTNIVKYELIPTHKYDGYYPVKKL